MSPLKAIKILSYILFDKRCLKISHKLTLSRFYVIVLSHFLDIDQLISFLVQIPKKEDLKIFEKKITDSISLKHVIQLVPTLHEALKDAENSLFKAYFEVI